MSRQTTVAKTVDISYGVKTSSRHGVVSYRLGSESTLYNMAKHGVKMIYKNHWNETKVLPTQIQHELLVSWLKCDETIPESDEDIERILRRCAGGWESLKPVTPTIFLYLMRLPDGVPPFAYERNHVIWDYYRWKDGETEKLICEGCLAKKGQFFKPYSANMWLERGWVFTRVKDHDVYDREDLLSKVIWDANNWCNECIYEPLWIHILDDIDCLDEFDYHLKRRRRWSSSSSEDSDIDYRKESIVLGNRMCSNMYKILKDNKML